MKAKDWLVFILLGAIWSSSFMWIKIAVEEIGPITLVAFRVLFGLIFGFAVILVTRQKLSRSLREWLPLLLLGITNVAIPFFLISWGEQVIDSAVAAILDATVPLFAIVIAHLALHDDKITLPKILGLLMGFAGVVVLHDVSSLRNVLYGASAIAPERLKQAIETFGPVFTQFFGQTEAPMALTALPREAHVVADRAQEQAVLSSAGRATYPTAIRLVDDSGRDVPPGTEGELIASAPRRDVRLPRQSRCDCGDAP